jgi:hypothetical protein
MLAKMLAFLSFVNGIVVFLIGAPFERLLFNC